MEVRAKSTGTRMRFRLMAGAGSALEEDFGLLFMPQYSTPCRNPLPNTWRMKGFSCRLTAPGGTEQIRVGPRRRLRRGGTVIAGKNARPTGQPAEGRGLDAAQRCAGCHLPVCENFITAPGNPEQPDRLELP